MKIRYWQPFALLLSIALVFSGCANPVGSASASQDISDMEGDSRAAIGGGVTSTDVNGTTAGLGWSTATWKLGAIKSGSYITFGVYSKNATKVMLEIYDNYSGENALASVFMEKGTDNIWRAKISISAATALADAVYYGYRCWGPNWTYSTSWARGNSSAGFISDCDSAGNRFNPNKVLFDPYAREISHDKSNPTVLGTQNAGMFGTGADLYNGVARRNFDTGKWAPKAVVIADTTGYGTKPKIAQKDAIIYEAHVRGLTKHPSTASLTTILGGMSDFSAVTNVPTNLQGTYAGAALMAPYLKALGVNTIELLPVHETDNDANPDSTPGGNFWGYMTYGYFAPDRRYSSDKTAGGPTREFKKMVAAFHAAGIEVYLDVVYNHSGEGGVWDTGNTAELTFMRGLDNSTYYSLVPSNKKAYWETTGCGNNLQCDNAAVRSLITDSLTYWCSTMGVDGFRFDLAPVLGRVSDGTNWNFSSSATTLSSIYTLGATNNVEMIAEAWDCGTYQVGNFPGSWAEWNGRFRDSVRNIMKGTFSGSSYADAFYGDYANFNNNGGPQKSVNFITAHDGFTLADLVSYDGKNNSVAWPFGPSDGGNDSNDSWSSNDANHRRQRIRNFYTFLTFARGVPMLVYGDEFGRTQNGNNNPYNIDSVATWNNYNMIASDAPQSVSTGGGGSYINKLGTDTHGDSKNNLFLFTKYLLNLRKSDAVLRQGTYSMPIEYTKNDGSSGFNSTSDRCVRIRMDGSSVSGEDYLICMNMWTDQVSFTIPAADTGKKWVRIVDTAYWAESVDNCWTTATGATISGSYGVNAWSIVVLKAVTQ